jgi:outer membrane protein assembly factor BamB
VEAPVKERRLRVVDVMARSVSDLGPVDGVLSYPAFSADGSRVVIPRQNGWGKTVACLLDHRTGSLTCLAVHDARCPSSNLPAISADGKTVFYAHRGELWSIEADTGTSRRRLSQDRFRQCSECRVDASGTHLLYLTNDRSIVSFLLE